jgi:GDPmannose 4,6-dehydratase
MWQMLQADDPVDYVIATGVTHTIRHACDVAFGHVGLDWERYVVIDERFLRPAEVELLVGDASKAERELGWKPDVTFEEMMAMMVDTDVARLTAAH